MSKYSPQNREEAFAHQIIDTASKLIAMALAGQDSFDNQLQIIEAHIAAYRTNGREDNARLIAQAPAMYEAIKGLLGVIEDWSDLHNDPNADKEVEKTRAILAAIEE